MGALPRCVLMAIHTPSYITKNRLGIYLFQIKLPTTIRCHISTKKVLFRKSLKTRNRNHALKLARFLVVIMNHLFKKYFDDPESYGKAMQLLASYDLASEKSHSFSEFEEMFLSGLDEYEDYLLEKAITMRVPGEFVVFYTWFQVTLVFIVFQHNFLYRILVAPFLLALPCKPYCSNCFISIHSCFNKYHCCY